MGRGEITDTVREMAKEFLGRGINVRELRLYPYLDFTMKNSQKLEINRVSKDERRILQILREEGHIEGGASGLTMTWEFYEYINRVLWVSYVGGDRPIVDCDGCKLHELREKHLGPGAESLPHGCALCSRNYKDGYDQVAQTHNQDDQGGKPNG